MVSRKPLVHDTSNPKLILLLLVQQVVGYLHRCGVPFHTIFFHIRVRDQERTLMYVSTILRLESSDAAMSGGRGCSRARRL